MIEEQKISRELITELAKLKTDMETKSDDFNNLKELGVKESSSIRDKLKDLEAKLSKLQSSHHTEG